MGRWSQWLIIHGRAAGKLFAPPTASAVRLAGRQHPHDAGCRVARVGACALRSFVAFARRAAPSIPENAGAVNIARRAEAPHPAQGCGSWNAAIGRTAENGPHASHR